MEKVLNYIKQHDTIIIHRHSRPDMDAIGAQIGLKEAILATYPNKKVYAVGDLNKMSYKAEMDEITDETYASALVIIVDVAVSHLVSDDRYILAKELIIIDHHTNPTDIKCDYFYQKSEYTSACETIVEILKEGNYNINSQAATYLYAGMVTDTGRFLYISPKTASHAFLMASYITQFNPEISDFYDFLYTEPLAKRQAKNLFSTFELTSNHVAYRKNTNDLILASGLDLQGVSRGMVNQMAGIEEIKIWASFTEDIENNVIIGEFRSRGIIIVDIAKKYGGGGHNFACGASLKTWEEVDSVINDLNIRAGE